MVLKGHRGQVWGLTGLTPSADGRLLVSRSLEDGTVRIWDLATGEQQHVITQERVGNTVKLWDVTPASERRLVTEVRSDLAVDRRPVGQKRPHRDTGVFDSSREPMFEEAALLSDNNHLAIYINKRVDFEISPDDIILYDLKNGRSQTVLSLSGPGKRPVGIARCLFDSTRDNIIAVTYNWERHNGRAIVRTEVCVYEALTRKVDVRFGDPDLHVSDYRLSHDGSLMCMLGRTDYFASNRRNRAGRLSIWDVRTGKRVALISTGGHWLDAAYFSPNGRELAIQGGLDHNTVFLCYLSDKKITRMLTDFRTKPGQQRTPIGRLTYTPDGKYLIATGSNGTILIWDSREYREVFWGRLYPSGGATIAFTPDGKKMVSMGGPETEQGLIRVWDTNQILSLIPGREGR